MEWPLLLDANINERVTKPTTALFNEGWWWIN